MPDLTHLQPVLTLICGGITGLLIGGFAWAVWDAIVNGKDE